VTQPPEASPTPPPINPLRNANYAHTRAEIKEPKRPIRPQKASHRGECHSSATQEQSVRARIKNSSLVFAAATATLMRELHINTRACFLQHPSLSLERCGAFVCVTSACGAVAALFCAAAVQGRR